MFKLVYNTFVGIIIGTNLLFTLPVLQRSSNVAQDKILTWIEILVYGNTIADQLVAVLQTTEAPNPNQAYQLWLNSDAVFLLLSYEQDADNWILNK